MAKQHHARRKTPRAARKRAIEVLDSAVTVLGGQNAAARVLTAAAGRDPEANPIRQGHVWRWLNRSPFPVDLAPTLVLLCAEKGHAVNIEELCPEYPWHKLRAAWKPADARAA